MERTNDSIAAGPVGRWFRLEGSGHVSFVSFSRLLSLLCAPLLNFFHQPGGGAVVVVAVAGTPHVSHTSEDEGRYFISVCFQLLQLNKKKQRYDIIEINIYSQTKSCTYSIYLAQGA